MTLFKKLFVVCLLLSVLALALSAGVTAYLAQSTDVQNQTQQLLAYGHELANTLQDREWSPESLQPLQETINTLDRTKSACVWLLDTQGQVQLHSDVAGQFLRGPRVAPETMRQVLAGTTVVLDRRQSGSTETAGPAVVVPVFSAGTVRGALYLVPSIGRERAYPTLAGSRFFLLGFGLAALVLTGVSYFVSRRIAEPVTAVSAAVQQVARGDLGARVTWQSNDEVGHLAESFNEMAAELERLERVRKELIANVSHELKGPLARMAGYLEAIHDDVGGPDARQKHLAIVRRETARLSRLVRDLLDISRLEAGRMPLHLIPCDLAPSLIRAAEIFQAPAAAAGLTLHVAIPSMLPIVEADPERIEQALTNLLENALAHTPPGGVISVTVREESGRLHAAVTDTGPGLPAAELERVWERFYKVDRARTPGSGGSGLGLAIVRQLVELHHGAVTVQSTLGQGSTFGFWLPLAKPMEQSET